MCPFSMWGQAGIMVLLTLTLIRWVGVGLGLLWRQSDYLTARLDWGFPLVSVDGRNRTAQESGVYFSIHHHTVLRHRASVSPQTKPFMRQEDNDAEARSGLEWGLAIFSFVHDRPGCLSTAGCEFCRACACNPDRLSGSNRKRSRSIALPKPDTRSTKPDNIKQRSRCFSKPFRPMLPKVTKLRQALTLSNLALTYQQLGAWAEANRAIAESLDLVQGQGRSDDRLQVLAQALMIQGQLQFAQGQSEPALTRWQQATATFKQLKDTANVVQSQINQAQALQALGTVSTSDRDIG